MGPIHNKMPNGEGIVVLENGNSFSGCFKNSIIDSNGILNIKDQGVTITGNFVDYKPHGTVAIQYKQGEKYVGEVKKGLHHGIGLISTPNGIQFLCQFENHLEKGYGILKDS